MPGDEKSLARLRRHIDEIDGAIHDLLMKRTEVAQRIGAVKSEDSVYMRPGREAVVLRRLIERHEGDLPKALIVRIWREIFAAVTALQGDLAVAVYAPEGTFGYRNLARDHYGWRTPITAFRSAAQVLEAVMEGKVTVGVLPIPYGESVDPWWRNLAQDGPSIPRIVARLPFAAVEPPGSDSPEALAISLAVAEPTERDLALLVVETGEPMSRGHLKEVLAGAGLEAQEMQVLEDEGGASLHLLEVEGFVEADDERLARLREGAGDTIKAVWAIGGFAEPLSYEEMTSRNGAGDGP
ncbi:MAG: chorismate mutase [Kiloniellales bacterium]|jgi:chorismate mutase-like protein